MIGEEKIIYYFNFLIPLDKTRKALLLLDESNLQLKDISRIIKWLEFYKEGLTDEPKAEGSSK